MSEKNLLFFSPIIKSPVLSQQSTLKPSPIYSSHKNIHSLNQNIPHLLCDHQYLNDNRSYGKCNESPSDNTDCSDDSSISSDTELQKYHPVGGRKGRNMEANEKEILLEEYTQVFKGDYKTKSIKIIEDPKDAEIAYLKYQLAYVMAMKPMTEDEIKFSYFRDKRNKKLMNEFADIKEAYEKTMMLVQKMEMEQVSLIVSSKRDSQFSENVTRQLELLLKQRDGEINIMNESLSRKESEILKLASSLEKLIQDKAQREKEIIQLNSTIEKLVQVTNEKKENKDDSSNKSEKSKKGHAQIKNKVVNKKIPIQPSFRYETLLIRSRDDECDIYVDKQIDDFSEGGNSCVGYDNFFKESITSSHDMPITSRNPVNQSISRWSLYFQLKTSNAITGELISKKFTDDFFFKKCILWVNPNTKTLHWMKQNTEDKTNSKYLISKKSTTRESNITGVNKGSIKAIGRLNDCSGFAIETETGDLLRLQISSEHSSDWLKLLRFLL